MVSLEPLLPVDTGRSGQLFFDIAEGALWEIQGRDAARNWIAEFPILRLLLVATKVRYNTLGFIRGMCWLARFGW